MLQFPYKKVWCFTVINNHTSVIVTPKHPDSRLIFILYAALHNYPLLYLHSTRILGCVTPLSGDTDTECNHHKPCTHRQMAERVDLLQRLLSCGPFCQKFFIDSAISVLVYFAKCNHIDKSCLIKQTFKEDFDIY